MNFPHNLTSLYFGLGFAASRYLALKFTLVSRRFNKHPGRSINQGVDEGTKCISPQALPLKFSEKNKTKKRKEQEKKKKRQCIAQVKRCSIDNEKEEQQTTDIHADSKSYSGTPALKADFKGREKNFLQGFLNDGKNSVKRYWINNNFKDSQNQDNLDMLLGNYDLKILIKKPRWGLETKTI
ncbi:phosphatidylinositide phosphatase sac1 [Anaeramoeba flamelloides]|uniref:Phosphatidylinositide phosphatase sac1 n=1 Tax=Anaeramoeba flamelloides TaxID=1746091 RepID=A0ABQ8XJ52_9EUKA|nr:phosphatidylinositide phosphatase sac1 [Anaeramoeba flamelloides]